MARTSLEHSFLPGESLWAAPDNFTRRKSVCSGPITTRVNPTPACAELLKSSDRAAAQWELERRFVLFESPSR
jgi:adenosine deaminase